MGNHPVLEERLIEITHVVDDDFAAGGGQRENAVGEVAHSAIEGFRQKARLAPGAMSWMICIIARPSSVPPAARSLITSMLAADGNASICARTAAGRAAEVDLPTVGQHANPDAGAIDA